MEPFAYPPTLRGAGPFPRGALALVAALGLVLALGGAAQAWFFAATGFPLTAVALAVAAAPAAAMLLAIGLAPAWADRALGRFTRATLADGGHVFALVVLVVTLFTVFGLFSLVEGTNAFEDLGRGNGAGLDGVTEAALLTGLVLNFFVLVAPVAIWLSFVHGVRVPELARAMGLGGENALFAAGAGVLAALGAIALIAIASLAATQGGVEVPENDRALDIARSLSIPAAIAVAVLSSVTEEVFFRAFLYPRVGLVAQGALFSLAHLSYVNVLEMVVTFLLGIAFALLYRRTRSLWAPVAAHFAFNLIMLLAGRFAG